MFNFNWLIGISVWFMELALPWKILLVSAVLVGLANVAVLPLDYWSRKRWEAEEEFKRSEELCGKMR